MSAYFVLKVVHILSAAVLAGTGCGIAFFKWIIDRTGNVSAIRIVSEKVVLADWIFTLPAIIVQAVTGVALAHIVGYPLTRGWLFWGDHSFLPCRRLLGPRSPPSNSSARSRPCLRNARRANWREVCSVFANLALARGAGILLGHRDLLADGSQAVGWRSVDVSVR